MMRFLAILLLCVPLSAATFPLEASGDGRYIVDQEGEPYLLKSMTLWHLIVNISTNDAATTLDTIAAKGFNAVQTRLIDDHFQADSADNSNPPPENYYGESPFTGSYTWTSLNEDYFERAKWVIDMAAQKGFTILLYHCYPGFSGNSEGFREEISAAAQADLESYGTYVGNYFESCPNIIWVANGDYALNDGVRTKVKAMTAALSTADPTHLISAHISGTSRSDGYNESWLSLNGIYAARPANEGNTDWQLSPAKPIHHLDGPYEDDSNGLTEQQMRGQPYYSMFAGALVGNNLGHQIVSEGRTGWRDNLNTTVLNDRIHAWELFESREWWKFVPDYTDTVITSSKGNINTQNYIATCRASDGRTVMAYLYAALSVTVDMTEIAGSTARAWWYNPTDGTATLINTYSTSGTQEFTSVGERILVIDQDGEFENEPGEPPPSDPGTIGDVKVTELRVGTIQVAP